MCEWEKRGKGRRLNYTCVLTCVLHFFENHCYWFFVVVLLSIECFIIDEICSVLVIQFEIKLIAIAGCLLICILCNLPDNFVVVVFFLSLHVFFVFC